MKAQTGLEYTLLLGAAILAVVVVLIVVRTGPIATSQNDAGNSFNVLGSYLNTLKPPVSCVMGTSTVTGTCGCIKSSELSASGPSCGASGTQCAYVKTTATCSTVLPTGDYSTVCQNVAGIGLVCERMPTP